ncbi:MAG: acyl carrier protein [Sphingomonas sp.]|uniref:acyl carrier protein n=1 Tax=Sphingomonas sp. TaxID=28214 RepID=UPI0026A4CA31|nr:acyl carrier protein [Sphingomonas sp.]
MDDQDAIYAMLTELISRTTERDQIVVADTPLDALGLDSLGLIEVIFELEERYNVDLPFNANEMAQNSHQATVGNIVDMVVRARAGVDSK